MELPLRRLHFLLPLLFAATLQGQMQMTYSASRPSPQDEGPLLRGADLLTEGISPMMQAATPAPAQTWFTVVPASQQGLNVTVTMPTGTQYQIVAQPCPNPVAVPVATATVTPVVDYADGVNGRPADSCPGFAKAFQVLQTAAVQQIQVTTSGKVTTVGVPALVAPPPVPTPNSTSYILSSDTAKPLVLTINSDGTWTLSGGGKAVKQ